ncbi:MAG: flotillin family protein [Prochloraceae cyanobacterium]
MFFWLTFIQSLPAIELNNLEIIEENNMNPQQTIIAQSSEPNSFNINLSQVNGFNLPFSAIVIPGIVFTLIILLIVAVFAYTRVYVITPNNEAFVRTGGVIKKDKNVILNGGCVVLPGFHEITRVPLREISIDVERTGKLAVRTQDYLRANMRVTFYVCISPNKEDVLVAAARLSKQGKISESDIKEALEKRADDAIRAAAKRKSIAEIDSDKLGFADEVLNLIQLDLKKVGLTLNNIAISEIEESDTYDENNFFDAQGVKLRTETIQKSIEQKLNVELKTEQQKKELELSTKVAIEAKELEATKQSLNIAKEKEEAKLNQAKEIEFLKAQQAREIQESQDQEEAKIERNKILQAKAVEEEKIQQNLAVQQSQIDANIALEERNKALKIAQIEQQQQTEVAEINRKKILDASKLTAQIEVADAEKQSKIAQQESAIAIAQKSKDRFAAEAEKAQAEAAVITASEVEKAEREQRLSAIAAEREAQQARIKEQNVVEIDLFRRKRQAEIARQAAELEAESIRTLAEAERYKSLAEAQSKKALIQAENALSDANRTAELIKAILPELAPKLPEIVKALAPQPGVLGNARVYSFGGNNGNSNGNGNVGDINKLLLSTSGMALLETLLDEGKLGEFASQVKQLLSSDNKVAETAEEIQELPQNPQIESENGDLAG